MRKQYYRFFIILLFVSFIVPQIVFASWWNPFSWHIWNNVFHKQTIIQPIKLNAPLAIPTLDIPIIPVKSEDANRSNQPSQQQTQQDTKQIVQNKTTLVCTPNWQCGSWSTCTNSQQTRTCSDSNSCGITTEKPSETQPCVPTYVMPDKPIIESFCDNKGNCVHSYVADPGDSSPPYPYPTVHVGDTLNFTIKVSGEETSGVLAFILPQEYDWVKEGGIKPWGTDLTYTKTFSTEDISARYFIYAYIKSSNDNYHRRSSGCNWTQYSCDDNAQLMYTVLP